MSKGYKVIVAITIDVNSSPMLMNQSELKS